MNPSTASHRLVKDILFKFINDTGLNYCFHCNLPMTRDDYSIEHKTPWLDSENPVDLYFDLNNISFSHLSCNVSKERRLNKGKINPSCGTIYAYQNGCRCDLCKSKKSQDNKKRKR